MIVDGEVRLHDGTVRTMDVETAERERDHLQHRLGWETSVGGSSPPDGSIARRVSLRPLLRAAKQYGRGVVADHLP